MVRRRVIKGALQGFLGTFTSRYSDFHGYWLLGQLLANVSRWQVDLLASPPAGDSLSDYAARLAGRRFAEQVGKSGVAIELVRSAAMEIESKSELVEGWRGDHRTQGHMFDVGVRVCMDTGSKYSDRVGVFIAPHDPAFERRRHADA
jgi:hypothetical protein